MTYILNHPLAQIILIIIGAFVAQFIAHNTITRLIRRSIKRAKGETKIDERKREDTIINVVSSTFTALLWLLVVCLILYSLGVNVAALLTGAGLIGVFVGLSAQATIRDLLAGIFILAEEQYRVGDIIQLSGGTTGVNGASGKVEEITLRITKLRDDEGRLVTVRNGDPSVVINKTFSYSSVVIDVDVTYDSNIDEMQKIMNDIGQQIATEEEWKDRCTDPIKFLRVDNFTDNGVTVKAVGSVKPASQWDVEGEYRRRLLEAITKSTKVHLAHSK